MARASEASAAAEGVAARAPWIRGPWWDLGGLAFCWVPYYLWLVFGLGIDGTWSVGSDGGREPGLSLAITVALGASYVHRHLTFLLVYGDEQTFRRRRRAYLLLPALTVVGLALLMRVGADVRLEIPGIPGSMRPWMLALVAVGAWNIWHTLMQRHGLARVYAAKAGAGLQERAHGRRDLALLWSATLLVSVVVLIFRPETFAGIGNARRMLATFAPVVEGAPGQVALGLAGAGFAWFAYNWFRHERAADLPWNARMPRLSFLASTLALLVVMAVHGPVVGYLVFGTAHAIEYVFFFHEFSRRKFASRKDPSLLARALRQPLWSAPVFAIALLAAYVLLRDHASTDAYLVYYTATSLLHFLYDGWIWKVRRPEVSRPLGVK